MIENNDIVKLPEYHNEEIYSSLSQSVDWGARFLNIPHAWIKSRGEGITVLILDTGCPAQKKDGKVIVHPDLAGNIILDQCKSFVPGEDIYDLNGHGTACAGVIGALDNSLGFVGYAPDCKIITYKVLSQNGSGMMYWIRRGLEAAIKLKPDIVSMSLGSPNPNGFVRDLIKKLDEMNIPVICAAGNSGKSGVDYPAKYEEPFAIAAFDDNTKIADFSAVGDEVDFAFPGVNINTTWLNNGYTVISGTSFACPACAGLVALLLSKHKKQEARGERNDCKTTREIYAHLRKYAVNPDNVDHDSYWGYGYIDINKMFGAIDYTREPKSWLRRLWDRIKSLIHRK